MNQSTIEPNSHTDHSLPTPADFDWVAATFWQRLLAFLINRLLWLLPLSPVLAYEFRSITENLFSYSVKAADIGMHFWMSVGLCLLFACIQMASMAMTGQSIGKRIMGINIISTTHERTNLVQVLLMRYAFGLFGLIFIIDKTFSSGYGMVILILWYVALFCSWYWSLNRPLRQTWQDVISQTVVVQVHRKVKPAQHE